MNTPNPKSFNKSTIKFSYIVDHYPSFAKHVMNNYPADLSWTEKLYWHFNDIKEHPVCKICGKPVKFINFQQGYQIYCSKKCSNADPEKKELTKEIMEEKYGGTGFASKEIREKAEATSEAKYGVKNNMQSEYWQQSVKKKQMEKYGGIGNGSEIIKAKYKETMARKKEEREKEFNQ